MTGNSLETFTFWLTKLITEWNLAEREAQGLLCSLLGSSVVAHAVTCELKNVQLTNALRAAGSQLRNKAAQESVNRFCETFDRLREYRNFVIHGMQEMPDASSQRGPGVSVLAIEQAKGKLRIGTQAVNSEDLAAVSKYISAALAFCEEIRRHYEKGEQPPSLDKLHLPTRLVKNLRNHPRLSPQPQP